MSAGPTAHPPLTDYPPTTPRLPTHHSPTTTHHSPTAHPPLPDYPPTAFYLQQFQLAALIEGHKPIATHHVLMLQRPQQHRLRLRIVSRGRVLLGLCATPQRHATAHTFHTLHCPHLPAPGTVPQLTYVPTALTLSTTTLHHSHSFPTAHTVSALLIRTPLLHTFFPLIHRFFPLLSPGPTAHTVSHC